MTGILFHKVALSLRFDLEGWWIDELGNTNRHTIVFGVIDSTGLHYAGEVGRSVWFVAGPAMLSVTWRTGETPKEKG